MGLRTRRLRPLHALVHVLWDMLRWEHHTVPARGTQALGSGWVLLEAPAASEEQDILSFFFLFLSAVLNGLYFTLLLLLSGEHSLRFTWKERV